MRRFERGCKVRTGFVLAAVALLSTACKRPADYTVAKSYAEGTQTATNAVYLRLEDFKGADDASIGPAWQRIQQYCSRNTPAGLKALGCTVLAPCDRQYRETETIPICVGIRHVGCGSGNWDASTVYHFSEGTTGFRTYSQGACPFQLEHRNKASGRLILEAVGIVHDKPAEVSVPYFGVHAETNVALRDVWIRGFVHAVHISAGAKRNPSSVANGWTLERVRAERSEHAGVFITGPDVNCGLSTQLATGGNCRRASKWNQLFAPINCEGRNAETCLPDRLCAGLIDSSFIFSQHLAPRSASNKDLEQKKRYPAYVIRGSTNLTTLVGPYTENWSSKDEGINYAGPNVQVIGGNGAWSGPGLVLKGQRLNRLAILSDDEAELALGDAAGPRTFFDAKIRAEDGSRGWAMRYPKDGPFGGWFLWDYGRADRKAAYALAGREAAKTDGVPEGAFWQIGPRYFGPSRGVRIREGVGPKPPAPDASWPIGSRWLGTELGATGAIAEWVLAEIDGHREWRPLGRVQ